MESITTVKCSMCGAVHSGDYWHLRQFYTTNKKYKTGLDPRCKECKKEIRKKYAENQKAKYKENKERYKATHERRSLYAKYMNRELHLMSDNEISDAIEAIENRLKALKEEQQKRKRK